MIDAPPTFGAPPSYGLMAEFANQRRLADAIRRIRIDGYRQVDAYTPFPVDEVNDALALPRSKIGFIVLGGGILGALTGYFLPYWVSLYAYPIVVAGRPYNSVPMWVPIMFELTVLFASCAAVIGLFILTGLPLPYHPLFNVPRFGAATTDRFFVVIKSTDPRYDRARTRAFLESLGPSEVSDVPW